MPKNISLEETGQSYDQIFVYLDNRKKNIWKRVWGNWTGL